MNETQEKRLLELIIDFLIDSKNIHKAKSFVIKAYSNNSNQKIPVRFQLDDSPIDHLVVDYFQQEVLNDCNGINDYDDFIRLNCDLSQLEKTGYINYYLDKELTDKLNDELAPK